MAGIWVVEIEGNSNGKTKLRAEYGGKIVAGLEVNVFTKVIITLPQEEKKLQLI